MVEFELAVRGSGSREVVMQRSFRMKDEKLPPPWKRSAPKGGPHTKLTPESIAKAKAAAKKAGRKYPNLIDNMMAAREQREAEEKDE